MRPPSQRGKRENMRIARMEGKKRLPSELVNALLCNLVCCAKNGYCFEGIVFAERVVLSNRENDLQ